MKCLSIRQPWSWLIIHGGKDIENRDWPTKFRGRVLIHAGKKPADSSEAGGALAKASRMGIVYPPSYDLGGIIGSVEITDCVAASESPWFFGKYGFVLRNPIASPFRPWKGQLGFFDVPELAVSP